MCDRTDARQEDDLPLEPKEAADPEAPLVEPPPPSASPATTTRLQPSTALHGEAASVGSVGSVGSAGSAGSAGGRQQATGAKLRLKLEPIEEGAGFHQSPRWAKEREKVEAEAEAEDERDALVILALQAKSFASVLQVPASGRQSQPLA